MSWSIDAIGKTEDVNHFIQTYPNLPQPLKDMVALLAAPADPSRTLHAPPPGAIQVKTSGHYDPSSPGFSNVYYFSVNPVTLAPPAPVTEREQTPEERAANLKMCLTGNVEELLASEP